MEMLSEIRGMKILLVDDDEWIRDSLRIFFEAEGCHVLAVETAEEGLSAINNQTFDLLLVDYKLPGLDGLEFLKRIHNTQPDAIKILITAYLNKNLVSEAKKLNVQGLIEKPFTSDTIMASLAFTIQQRDRNARRELHESGG
ncbi:MAG: response regulator [Desulfobacterales bacterium]|jgi:DNA-binding NtrC family response regulator